MNILGNISGSLSNSLNMTRVFINNLRNSIFIDEQNVRTDVNEGDTTIQGRFNNSITLSSNQPTLNSPKTNIQNGDGQVLMTQNQKVDYSERYFIYPIHMQPEASTLVQSPFHIDQKAAIINISRLLPLNTILCVAIKVLNSLDFN